MRAKSIIAILAIAGLLVFVAVSVLGGSKDKSASTRTAWKKVEENRYSVELPRGTKSVPRQINYQGYLVSSSDSSAITDVLQMTFKIYGDSVGGSPDWEEQHLQVEVQNGLFNVLLGSANSFPDDLFTGQVLWLETTVEDDTLSPRKKLVSVPYAFKDDCWTPSGDDCYFDKSGNVGIGTDDPHGYRLKVVSGEGGINGIYGETDILACTAVTGKHTYPGAEAEGGLGRTGIGVIGQVFSSDSYSGYFEGGKFSIIGDVGIGTTDPSQKLDLNGNAVIRGQVDMNSHKIINVMDPGSNQDAATKRYVDDAIATGDNDWEISGIDMYSIPSGNVGIGTNSPAYKLDVASDVRVGDDLKVVNDLWVENGRVDIVPGGHAVPVGYKLYVYGKAMTTGSITFGFDYDTTFSINPGASVELTHSLGGDSEKYIVSLYGKNSDGIHQVHYGTEYGNWGIGKTGWAGCQWYKLTSSTITVHRAANDDYPSANQRWDQVIVRILKNQ